MEEKILKLFLEVGQSFDDVKEKVSLVKPYVELLAFSSGWDNELESHIGIIR